MTYADTALLLSITIVASILVMISAASDAWMYQVFVDRNNIMEISK